MLLWVCISPTTVNKWAVCILLECFLVKFGYSEHPTQRAVFFVSFNCSKHNLVQLNDNYLHMQHSVRDF